MYDVDRMPARISIGRETESGVTDVRVSCASWLKKWPGMKVTALHRPYGHDTYILRTEMVGSELVWTVSDADTSVPGTGKLEIFGEVDGKRKVSAMADVLVAGRMGGVVGPVPEPERPWVERAEGAADRAEDALQELRDKIASGEFKGEPGEPGKDAVVDDMLTQEGQAADAKATGEALAGKLTEPSTGLEVGKYFRIAALDENGHAVLEAVDLPSAPVQDVQVDGDTIVTDGVANVSKYAVVKEAMCDGKGAAWTEAEQAAARERMGLPGDYELIASLTTEEDAKLEVKISADMEGNAFSLRAMIIYAVFMPIDTVTNFYIFKNNENGVYEKVYHSSQAWDSSEKTYFTYKIYKCKDRYIKSVSCFKESMYLYDTSSAKISEADRECNVCGSLNLASSALISSINITTGGICPAGCKFDIYGVRA